MFGITGNINGKKYKSRKSFSSEKEALGHAYENLVYNPSGNSKRKKGLSNLEIFKR